MCAAMEPRHWPPVAARAKMVAAPLLLRVCAAAAAAAAAQGGAPAPAVFSAYTFGARGDGTHNDTWMKAGPRFVLWLQEFLLAAEAARGQSKKEQ